MTLDPKMRVRRRMAKTAFIAIIAGLLLTFAAILSGDEGTAARITAASGVLISLFGFLTTIVGGYMGTTAHADHTEKKNVDTRSG